MLFFAVQNVEMSLPCGSGGIAWFLSDLYLIVAVFNLTIVQHISVNVQRCSP